MKKQDRRNSGENEGGNERQPWEAVNRTMIEEGVVVARFNESRHWVSMGERVAENFGVDAT